MTVPGGARTQESRLLSQAEPLAVQPPRGSKLSSDRLRSYGGALQQLWGSGERGFWGSGAGETERPRGREAREVCGETLYAHLHHGEERQSLNELQDRARGTGGTGRGG